MTVPTSEASLTAPTTAIACHALTCATLSRLRVDAEYVDVACGLVHNAALDYSPAAEPSPASTALGGELLPNHRVIWMIVSPTINSIL